MLFRVPGNGFPRGLPRGAAGEEKRDHPGFVGAAADAALARAGPREMMGGGDAVPQPGVSSLCAGQRAVWSVAVWAVGRGLCACPAQGFSCQISQAQPGPWLCRGGSEHLPGPAPGHRASLSVRPRHRCPWQAPPVCHWGGPTCFRSQPVVCVEKRAVTPVHHACPSSRRVRSAVGPCSGRGPRAELPPLGLGHQAAWPLGVLPVL